MKVLTVAIVAAEQVSLSLIEYKDAEEVPWYIWFSLVYCFFILLIIGPVMILS